MTITIKKKMEILNQKKIFNGFDDFHLQEKKKKITNNMGSFGFLFFILIIEIWVVFFFFGNNASFLFAIE